MRTFLISFAVFFFIFIFIYLLYLLFNKARFTIKGVSICLIASFLFTLYSCLKLNKTVDDLREELDNYPQSVISEYLRDKYSFSDMVDIYGKEHINEYLYENFKQEDLYFYYGEDELLDFIRSRYAPYDIWSEKSMRGYGYYTLEEAYDQLTEQYQ